MQALAIAVPGVPTSDEAGAAVPVTVNVIMSPLAEPRMRLPNPDPKLASVQSAGTILLAVSEEVMPAGVNQVGEGGPRNAPEWGASTPLADVIVAVRVSGVLVPAVIWGLSHRSWVPTVSTYVLKPKSAGSLSVFHGAPASNAWPPG